jgi:CheY-like chemotaxis protein
MEKTFLAEPFQVVTVPSGEAAITQARELKPSIIVVDAGMAGVSGYDVCKSVRDDPDIGRTPLIIMSGVSNLYDESKGNAVGVTQHLKKPFDTGQLIRLITELAVVPEEAPAEPPAEPVVPEVGSLPEPPLETVSMVPELDDNDTALPEVEMESEDAPEVELDPASEPIPLSKQPSKAAGSPSPLDMNAPTGKKVGTTTRRDFGRPVRAQESRKPQIEPLQAAQESEFGEVPLGVEESESVSSPEVAPIELKTSKPSKSTSSFQVGTLAELAQMDGRARPIAHESRDDAVDIAGKKASALAKEALPMAKVSDSVASEPSLAGVAATVRDRVDDAAKDLTARVEGISVEQAEAIQTLTREVIERVVWEVVPNLAEVIIKEELHKLLEE